MSAVLKYIVPQCNHLPDDGSDECGNVDDCVFHAMIDEIDAALAEYAKRKQEGD